MKTHLLFLPLLATALLGLSSCSSRERSTTGIANEQGMITGNVTTDPKKDPITWKDVRKKTEEVIPDW